MTDDDALIAALSRHIAGLTPQGDCTDILDDAHRLIMASRGRLLAEYRDAAEALETLAQCLDQAEAAAVEVDRLMGALRHVEPSGLSLAEIIEKAKTDAHHKLRLGRLQIGGEEALGKNNPDWPGRFVALSAGRIYWRRTKDFPTKGKPKGAGSYSSEYLNFLDAILSELRIGRSCIKWGHWAVDRLKEDQKKQ